MPEPAAISEDQWKRSYITIIRRNWHLLPYEQLLQLLGWTEDELAFTLREDDFLYIKLGSLKPNCPPLAYAEPSADTVRRAEEIGATIATHFPEGLQTKEPLFHFVEELSSPPHAAPREAKPNAFDPRYCSSYFALYGDPFLEPEYAGFPDGYLQRLRNAGVNGVWMQGILYKLAPFPWDRDRSEGWETRLKNLAALAKRVKDQGLGIYLYMNEPRTMPLAFFEAHPELKGVTYGDYAALCTSVPEIRAWMAASIELICREAPDLAGFFTISASENPTSCWSHNQGATCPRCSQRTPAEVIAEVSTAIQQGIDRAGHGQRLIAWDWGWADDWAPGIIERLPQSVTLQSVSEWSIPIQRGGIDSVVGEYSISVVGPGPRAMRHWALARDRGLRIQAKVQANNTWELSSVPYIPAVAKVAEHAQRLKAEGIDGIQLGWTLGGCPSPNLEVFAAVGEGSETPLDDVAKARFGEELAPLVIEAWKGWSAALDEYPYHIGVAYNGPQQVGPANPLWAEPTGYASTMVGFPYDQLDGWRAVFPPEVFADQFEKVAKGFRETLAKLQEAAPSVIARSESSVTSVIARSESSSDEAIRAKQATQNFADECRVAEACAIHFQSVANQSRFVMARNALAMATTQEEAKPHLDTLEQVLQSELQLAKRLFALQSEDSRLGYEASNHYFFVPIDLAAKVVNCTWLLEEWLPGAWKAK
ncbi:MAG: hypothetical protein IT368_00490 [Candidatus Hydrogenedentes bacterium]|nr:hypothetical protein [Candidatus Hydrogenedentota bacterium]